MDEGLIKEILRNARKSTYINSIAVVNTLKNEIKKYTYLRKNDSDYYKGLMDGLNKAMECIEYAKNLTT